jgi:hypothetical protein
LPTPIDHHKGKRKKEPKEKPHKQKYVGCLHLFGISISPEKDGLQSSLYGGPQRIMPVYKQ